MAQVPSSPYSQGVVSARSRRLRTIGLLLLIAILGMTWYGIFFLMPSLRVSAQRTAPLVVRRIRPGLASPGIVAAPSPTQAARNEQQKKAFLAQFIFMYAYWSVCALLILAALLVAWLDLREVLRNYAARRRALWSEAVARTRRERQGYNGRSEG